MHHVLHRGALLDALLKKQTHNFKDVLHDSTREAGTTLGNALLENAVDFLKITATTCSIKRLRFQRATASSAQVMARLAGGEHLIREPIGFQSARGNAVDEPLKLRETWAAIWRANALGPALAWPEDNGPLFHWP